jgi:hypothetical protein
MLPAHVRGREILRESYEAGEIRCDVTTARNRRTRGGPGASEALIGWPSQAVIIYEKCKSHTSGSTEIRTIVFRSVSLGME